MLSACLDTESVGLGVIKNQGLANEFGNAPDYAEPDKLDSPDFVTRIRWVCRSVGTACVAQVRKAPCGHEASFTFCRA